MAQNNLPQPFESFLLAEGEKKITIQPDSKFKNTATFIIMKEDHTLGQLLKAQLMKDKKVIFSGYKMPHPLEFRLELRVQTIDEGEGVPQYTPQMALENAIQELMSECTFLEDRFKQQVEARRARDDMSSAYL